ncbi:MAG: MFS transporter [Chloroflexota bacterium]|nr:MFS transporter [Chloroflexota bacterium]
MTGSRRLLTINGMVFLAVGFMGAVIGPALPELARNTSSTLGEAGAIFTALFAGSLPTQIAGGQLIERFGHKRVAVIGMLVMAAGLVGVSLSHSLPVALLFMALAGLGDGAVIISVNVLIAVAFSSRSVSALNLLNVFYGVGAISGPLLVGLFLGSIGAALPALWVVALFLSALVPMVAGLKLPYGAREPVTAGADRLHVGSIYRSPLLWILSASMLVYVGLEIGTGGWITTYMVRTSGIHADLAALVASSFWLALTTGRLVAAYFGRKSDARTVLLVAVTGAAASGSLLALVTGNTLLTLLAVPLLGFSLAPVYPTLLAITTGTFSAVSGDESKAASVVISCGSAGGMLLPWVQGLILEGVGTGAAAFFAAGLALTLLTLYGAYRLLERGANQAAAAALGGEVTG